ncbi:hypothetical protein N7541_005455 [Penicillium brevicompactum]|uniref:ubiquitinyl hydrolase 1 n=1 Tax=Penicillium brevicompactum TaxID=5074 RepID=A0A9W9RDK5_PENBR|nr:hypothetical protein N7541_005455 [Penicillium brevicompactum]
MNDPNLFQGMSLESSSYIFHHVFLPPRTPQEDDHNFEHERFLLDTVIEALSRFRNFLPTEQFDVFNEIITMTIRLRATCALDGDGSEIEVTKLLHDLKDKGGFLPIFVREQNAGIFLSKYDNKIQVESFELSPRNESVTSTVGRLVRVFPGPAMTLDLAAFNEPGLLETLSQTLVRMGHQPAADTKPKVSKAQQEHDEDRDTTHPMMVTELLMSTLRPLSADAKATQIRKNTREEVMWRDSRSPWRRSALWLLVRVTLQLLYRRLSDEARLDDLYKQFMVFFMNFVVDKTSVGLSSEAIYCMNAKIVRRLLKLNLSGEPAWFSPVRDILRRSCEQIQGRWTEIRRKNSRSIDTSSLSTLDFRHDIQCAIPDLDLYLKGIGRRGHDDTLREIFNPASQLSKYKCNKLPDCLEFAEGDYQRYNLAAFEDWVAVHLNGWTENHMRDQASCSQLGRLMMRYHEAASSSYVQNPEAISVMLLTLLELWIACDKSAIQCHHELGKYDACIPVNCFQSLLLPFKSQMTRLAQAESYLSQRQRNHKYHGSGIFHDYGTRNCFSVRYFDQSDEHQRLLKAIEDHATQKRAEKKAELQEKQQRYRHLMNLVSQTVCQQEEVILDARSGFRQSRHSHSCPCHRYKKEARSIEISVHEWPLPSAQRQAKSTVFELQVPKPFGSWRDTTLFFLYNCLGVQYVKTSSPRAEHRLKTYSGLSSFFTSHGRHSRIGLLSQNKPHKRTHRRDRLIVNVTETDICLNNGLSFQYYDDTVQCYVSAFERTLQIANSCVYTLPQQSSALQQFIFRPAQEPHGPPPNEVIATQFAAPANMSMEEYKALTSMPLGLEIQWQNILVELAAPSVDIKKVETAIFVFQIINQTGPSEPTTCLRQGHAILGDRAFVVAMLSRIKEVTERIKENWEMIHALSILARLVLRILSLSPVQEIHDVCLHCLTTVRQVAFHWVNTVRRKASETVDDAQKNRLIERSVHIALICVETFDAEDLAQVFATSSDISVFLQCGTVIWNGRRSVSAEVGSLVPILYYRWQVLSYRSHSFLGELIVRHKNPGMDLAIHEAWAAYREVSVWSAEPNVRYWLFTKLDSQSTAGAHTFVHYNLLTGELLVNGLPLTRLPSEYESYGAYRRLFGKSQLDVMPSSSPGMQFSCQTKYRDHTVHLGKGIVSGSKEYDLSVQAVRDGRVWEYVPSRLLAGIFPDAFVTSYVHWYDVEGDYVEFRSAEKPWSSDGQQWRLTRANSHIGWRLEKNGTLLLSAASQTASVISNIFQPVEKPLKIHMMLHDASSVLWIKLPRLCLEFSLQPRSSSIRSRQYLGMSVDNDQSLDSLIGQSSKIILAGLTSRNRLVLIPEGRVSYAKAQDHVCVGVDWQSQTTLHAYPIDEQLGRLVDNGTLQSKLFLCYLHALTSFCLPDPLTKKTGTEQALFILRSASVRSFDRLQPEQIALLSNIASLSPARAYYPANERVMQSVCWRNGLGSLSQHQGFREEVNAIFDQDRRTSFFYQGAKLDYPPLPHVEPELLLRDRIRTSSFRVSGFGAEDHTDKYDHLYEGLDASRITPAGIRSFAICKMLYDGIPRIQSQVAEKLTSQLWRVLSSPSRVHGPSTHLDIKRLRYDSEWIMGSTEFIASYWCCIHQLVCSRRDGLNKFQLMAWLSTIAFSGKTEMVVLEIIAFLFLVPEAAFISPPASELFMPSEGYEMDGKEALSWIKKAEFDQTPESNLVPVMNETYPDFTLRRKTLQQKNRSLVRERILLHFASEWPTRSPSYPTAQGSPRICDYLDLRQAWSQFSKGFNIWMDNEELRQWITRLATFFCNQRSLDVKFPAYHPPSGALHTNSHCGFVCFDNCLQSLPDLDNDEPGLPGFYLTSSLMAECPPGLAKLVDSLAMIATSKYEKWYVAQLQSSVASMKGVQQSRRLELSPDACKKVILDYLVSCEDYAHRIHSSLMSQLTLSARRTQSADSRDLFRAQVVALAFELQQCPRLSPLLLLAQLSRHRWKCLDAGWKRCFVRYGCSITMLQRASRLASTIDTPDEFLKELQSSGHTNWDPYEFPETLLMEIENGILVRDVQESKSSVVVPIVVTAYANGSNLARVLVAKPQSRQMFQMLVAKLGGLLGRRVYHMPVSRSLKLGEAQADEIQRMCAECISLGGVLLVQPEHILSLKLMCLECFIVGKTAAGRSLFQILQLFHESSRDIVDESDENFNVKFELIYTMGAQRPVELGPQRWMVIQEALYLVRQYATHVKAQFPHSIEVSEHRRGEFPRIRLLDRDAEEAFLAYVGTHICESGIGSLPISRQTKPVREAILTYIMKAVPADHEVAAVEREDPTGIWGRRWRVDYGPDSNRDPPTRLSVPYRAKDSPSLRSEFSHPDVVILLTCLNYYYSGLQDDDIFLAFAHLVNSDQADAEYQIWVNDAPMLSPAYHQLVGVNLDDRHHCAEHIFPALRFAKAAVDYFLSHIVFPKEMKEFPDKLSASGWDIGEIKSNPTIGFSGTNDSRQTLPLGVTQLDLPEQNHTNALVLDFLLRQENSVAFIPQPSGPRSDAHVLLDMVLNLHPPAQVILDVGAQILELSNHDMAKAWLSRTSVEGPTQAVVFVNDQDDICVLDRNGRVESLQISPFARQMGACLVFLDEAHTRGIDLKLPVHYRAAVTLGPGITKDKLVQACMRMRQLGNGQSVVFCIPNEVDRSIRVLRGKDEGSPISVSDVLIWSISETWVNMRRSVPLWAVQGTRFERQQELWRSPHHRDAAEMTSIQAQRFLDPECQTIEQRYRPGHQERMPSHSPHDTNLNLNLIWERYQKFECLDTGSSTLQEEQERELAPEIEIERQVQRPPPASPEAHRIHPHISSFLATGVLSGPSEAYQPAFYSLRRTSAAAFLDLSQFPSSLLATRDFSTTIKIPVGSTFVADAFQRPVRWILRSNHRVSRDRTIAMQMMIISPYEANFLMPEIRKSDYVSLHLYAPRQNQSFLPLDRLTLYTVPQNADEIEAPDLLRIQLNLFSGQLYLGSHSEYKDLCEFLGVAYFKTPPGLVVAADGFIQGGNQGRGQGFSESPIQFLRVLTSQIRKDCQDIGRTHMGHILNGRLLFPSDFVESARSSVVANFHKLTI